MPAPRTSLRLVALPLAALALAPVVSCRTSAEEPTITSDNTGKPSTPPPSTPAQQPVKPVANDIKLAATKPPSPDDPLGGKWTMADATKDLPGSGPLVATIDTNHGKISCKLYDDKAPVTVANFIGLATGKRTWKSPSGQWVNTPAYTGTTFHRIIKNFMIQGGDAAGTGAGDPGYGIPDEMWDGGKHDRPGLLCMANRGAGTSTNGAQFFITESDGPMVTGLDHYHSYTIFGECTPVDVIHEIASVPTNHAAGDRPLTPVTINKVTVAREKH
jgi:peptidyl-prolyl cis-trans isomerase A (cyclophilin A)